MAKNKVNVVWFRRDLRFDDNKSLLSAALQKEEILPLFIFDEEILNELPADDARVSFIYENLGQMNQQLNEVSSSLLVKKGNVLEVWKELLNEFDVVNVFAGQDYEPYAVKRDESISNLLKEQNIGFNLAKDQVIFDSTEILKTDGKPYTVYTPYKNKWLLKHAEEKIESSSNVNLSKEEVSAFKFIKYIFGFPSLSDFGFSQSTIKVKPHQLKRVGDYAAFRDFPAKDIGSYLAPHLRFGTISIRKLVGFAEKKSAVYLSELIWREFFMQILHHFPNVVNQSFKPQYDAIKWRNNESDYLSWCKGETGYPLVDAGMRQLNETGYMHNRVRMVTASFLCKHLLIDWRWGEAYFAKKLLDYDLSANNGNWQWAAGTGCDAAPYFRIFNPTTQLEKFDKDLVYTRQWVKDLDELTYPKPIVDHKVARERCLSTYKEGLGK